MENTFKGFGEEEFNEEFQGFGFDSAEDVTAEVAPTTAPAPTGARSRLNDIPLSQINGMQNGKFRDLEAAQDAILSMDGGEVQRRKENGEEFQWVKTIIDKANWDDKDGKKVLKSPKFLGWLVIKGDSAGAPVAMTDAGLLAYITNHCPQTGKVGTGETGLQLRHAIRKNKSAKGGNFTNTIVISLVPMEKTISKYAQEKIEEAKYPLYEEDGVTPLTELRPGAPKDSKVATDYIQKYDWKPEYEEIFKQKRAKTKKKDQQSAEAFKILAFMQGLKPQA